MNYKTKKLNKQNNKMDQKLSKENTEIMTDIVCYLRGSSLSEWDIELVRQDLLDIFLRAEKDRNHIKNVIGEDFKSFCDEIIANIPPQKKWKRILGFFDMILLCVCSLIFSWGMIELFLENLLLRKPVQTSIPITLGRIIACFVISGVSIGIESVITRQSFKWKQLNKKIEFVVFFCLSFVVVGIFAVAVTTIKDVIATVPLVGVLGCIVLLYSLHVLIDKRIL